MHGEKVLNEHHGYHGSYRLKPVKQGAEYTLKVEEMSKRNDGVAKVNGFVVFIAGGKLGETYRVKIVKVGNRYAVGEIVSNEQSMPETQEEE